MSHLAKEHRSFKERGGTPGLTQRSHFETHTEQLSLSPLRKIPKAPVA